MVSGKKFKAVPGNKVPSTAVRSAPLGAKRVWFD